MSKQRRPPERETSTEGPRAAQAPTIEEQPALDRDVARSAPPSVGLGGAALATSPVADVAGRVALALRVAPRDAADVERLVAVVERSGLSTERKEALLERLRGDLDLAVRVADAVREALGRDDPAERSALIGALERATGAEADGRPPEHVVAERVAAETGHAAEAVEALCRALSGWILWWEEEEEEAPAGDYAAEESGT